MDCWVLCLEFKWSITIYYLHIIADSTKSVENQILKVTAETLLSFEAELKEISKQVCKCLGHIISICRHIPGGNYSKSPAYPGVTPPTCSRHAHTQGDP